jgi:SAM-dependent methyltransferase
LTSAYDPVEHTVNAPTYQALPSDKPDDHAGGQACLVCGGPYRPSRLPGLLQCRSCGFITADSQISDEELTALYDEDYFHGEEYFNYVAEEESLSLNFRDRLAVLRSLAPDWSQADLFEIGCAYGFFLKTVKPEVRNASGIDISADGVAHATGKLALNAHQGDYLAFDLGRKVDVVTMWDTIEHLKRPDLFIAKAANDLKSGGMLAITTGDIGSLNARLRGGRWRMIHPPTHLHYFSVATLTKLLNREGFEVLHVSHPGNTRRLDSVLYIILALKIKRPDLYARLRSWPFMGLRLTINLWDIMYVVARRK